MQLWGNYSNDFQWNLPWHYWGRNRRIGCSQLPDRMYSLKITQDKRGESTGGKKGEKKRGSECDRVGAERGTCPWIFCVVACVDACVFVTKQRGDFDTVFCRRDRRSRKRRRGLGWDIQRWMALKINACRPEWADPHSIPPHYHDIRTEGESISSLWKSLI